MSEQTEFGKLLRQFREEHNLSQFLLAQKYGRLKGCEFGMTTSTVTQWENGRRKPGKAEAVELVAQAIGITDKQRDQLLVAAGFVPKAVESTNAIETLKYALDKLPKLSQSTKKIIVALATDENCIPDSDKRQIIDTIKTYAKKVTAK
jgi:transcriptional regulator with XRE-family HTH domain